MRFNEGVLADEFWTDAEGESAKSTRPATSVKCWHYGLGLNRLENMYFCNNKKCIFVI